MKSEETAKPKTKEPMMWPESVGTEEGQKTIETRRDVEWMNWDSEQTKHKGVIGEAQRKVE